MDVAFDSVFYEIAVLVLLAAVLGFVGMVLRQPLVVAFIAAGVLAGPDALGLVASTGFIETLSQISIAVLLFLVGLKLDLNLVRSLGKVALATGLGQVGFTAFFGFLICLGLGIGVVPALYITVALTFSSTIIIVKLLSDKHEIEALHGKIALGFLIVQDIFVVLAMVALSTIGVGAADEGTDIGGIAFLLGGAVAMIVAVGLFIRFSAVVADRAVARTAGDICGWLGGGAGGGGGLDRLWQGTGRSSGRRLACLDPVPRGDRIAAGSAARFPASVLLHRPWRVDGPDHIGQSDLARDHPVAVRPDR